MRLSSYKLPLDASGGRMKNEAIMRALQAHSGRAHGQPFAQKKGDWVS